MGSLLYLVLHSAKNSLLELRRKPGKLVSYLLVIGVLVGMFFLGRFTAMEQEDYLPMYWLEGALFLFICLFAGTSIQSGLSSGSTFFEMCDVNFLFVSPLPPRGILLYGMVRLMKTAFFAALFILFQTGTLANFGVAYGGVLTLFGCFVLVIMVLTVLSLLLYSLTVGSTARKRAVRCVAAVLVLPLVCVAAASYVRTGDAVQTLAYAAQSPFLRLIPVAGWTAAGAAALLSGQTVTGLGFLAATAGLGVAAGLGLMLGKADYYEDVLCATETAFEKKRAMAEGNVHTATARSSGRKIHVSKTGLGGLGARVFLYKHVREALRERRFGPIALSSLLMAVGAAIMAMLMPRGAGWISVLASLLWMQVMMVGTGQGLKETYLHYIYLVPEPPFAKLVWSNLEKVVTTVIESILIFVPVGLIAGLGVGLTALCMAVYTLFVFALLGINLASMRWLGADLSAGLLLTLYFLIVLVLLAPGIVGAIAAGALLGAPIGLLVLAGWEALLGLATFWLARGILHNCDMPVVKVVGNK